MRDLTLTFGTLRTNFFTNAGKRKASTIGRAFLLGLIEAEPSLLEDYSSKELFEIYGLEYARKTGYSVDVARKRFYSSLSAMKKLVA